MYAHTRVHNNLKQFMNFYEFVLNYTSSLNLTSDVTGIWSAVSGTFRHT
jgi:hypothetical protein